MTTSSTWRPDPSTAVGDVALGARAVEFDWSATPFHYFDGSPAATHLVNVMHLLLPEGERWFAEVFQEALPMIEDERLRRDVIGFIGQESTHAASHESVHEFLTSHGLDPASYLEHTRFMFRTALGKRSVDSKNSLVERLAIVAAIEHLTSFLGYWMLTQPALDDADIDPTMLDLLRWHGAEEVEHRSVAFDVLQYFDSRRFRRNRAFLMVLPAMGVLWLRGARHLMARDPYLSGEQKRIRVRDMRALVARGLVPSDASILQASRRYFRKDFHPSQEGSTAVAVAYLAVSPAALASA